jgi:hypothetical protein
MEGNDPSPPPDDIQKNRRDSLHSVLADRDASILDGNDFLLE